MNNRIYVEMTDEEYEGFKKMKRNELIDVTGLDVVKILTIKYGKGIEHDSPMYLQKELLFNAGNGIVVAVRGLR